MSFHQKPIFFLDQPFFFGIPGWAFIVVPPMLYLVLLHFVFPRLVPRTVSQVHSCAKWRKRHNIALGCFSLVCALIAAGELAADAMTTTSMGSSLWAVWVCRESSMLMQVTNAVFILSKLWEWLDSGFLVWLANPVAREVLKASSSSWKAAPTAKVQISPPVMPTFLHSYHHMTTFAAFLLVVNLPGGAPKSGVFLNSAVHSFMYFAWSGVIRLGVFKPVLTAAQILQFFIVIFIWVDALVLPECSEFATFARAKPFLFGLRLEFLLPFMFTPVYLFEFLKLFVNSYVLKKKSNEE